MYAIRRQSTADSTAGALPSALCATPPDFADAARDFAPSDFDATDLSEIPPSTLDGLRDLDVLALDCLRIRPHETHLWLEKALQYVEELKPKRTYFTHITHDVKHERDSKLLPENVEWAYDGLVVV